MTREFPGFLDVHVHFRDPGVPEAETRRSGAAAAKRGGFAAVVTMPNTAPAGDNVPYLHEQIEDATLPIRIFPAACMTRGRMGKEAADLEKLAEAGAAFFTDDGSYVADDHVMEEVMQRAADLNLAVCQHAMDPKVQGGGVIRDCDLARQFHLPIIPIEAETTAIKRDLALCRVTGCRLHIQHISTAPGVELVRMAQREGLPVTAEATPHHLLLSCDDLVADDAAFKMAPPLGTNEDRDELRKAVKEGVLMFATDHAPHPEEKKRGGFAAAANGIIGLETAIPITYTVMVEGEGMSVEDWAKAWTEMPAALLPRRDRDILKSLPPTRIEIGEKRRVDVNAFASRSRNCPYDGMEFDCWPIVK